MKPAASLGGSIALRVLAKEADDGSAKRLLVLGGGSLRCLEHVGGNADVEVP